MLVPIAEQLLHICYFVVLPIFLLAGLGFLLQRRFGLDLQTLSRLSFYFIIPCFIYHSVVNSRQAGGQIKTVVIFTLAMIVCLWALTFLIARLRRIPEDHQNALVMTTIFYNSANYGLPIQDLAFRSLGLSAEAVLLQSFVIIVQNVGNFTLGVYLAARGRGNLHLRQALARIAMFPPIYALLLGILTVRIRSWLGEESSAAAMYWLNPFWQSIEYSRDALIAMALCTLGAQLASVQKDIGRFPVKTSVILRLVVSPLLGVGLIFILGIHGFVAQVLLVSCAMPTAVNTILLCLEFDNHPDYAAKSVFYSTLLSPLSVPVVIFLAQKILY